MYLQTLSASLSFSVDSSAAFSSVDAAGSLAAFFCNDHTTTCYIQYSSISNGNVLSVKAFNIRDATVYCDIDSRATFADCTATKVGMLNELQLIDVRI